MVEKICSAKTQKGKPCKNKANQGKYCYAHKGFKKSTQNSAKKTANGKASNGKAKSMRETNTKKKPVNYQAVVRSAEKITQIQEKTIEYMPGLVDNFFAYNVNEYQIPTIAVRMQKIATIKSREVILAWQWDLAKWTNTKEKNSAVLKIFDQIEKAAFTTLEVDDHHIPKELRTDLFQSFHQHIENRKKIGLSSQRKYVKFCKDQHKK